MDLTRDQAIEVAKLIGEYEDKVKAIINRKVDMLTVMHPSHEKGEKCEGVIISSSLQPEAAYLVVQQAMVTMMVSMNQMAEAMQGTKH